MFASVIVAGPYAEPPAGEPPEPDGGGVEPPLLERAAELIALTDAVAGLAAGRGGVVVLEAAAGLGKTVLLDRAARGGRARELRDAARVAPGRSSAGSASH